MNYIEFSRHYAAKMSCKERENIKRTKENNRISYLKIGCSANKIIEQRRNIVVKKIRALKEQFLKIKMKHMK